MSVLQITPRPKIKVALGEPVAFKLDCREELGTNTVKTKTMTIKTTGGVDVTAQFEGGITEGSGFITFGIKGYAVGTYKVIFWVTCNELLPDGSTEEKFTAEVTLIVK